MQLATWVLSQYADGLAEQALAAKSPSLLAALRRSQQSALELDPDVLTALHRYAVRASTRATPLMLFAGIATSPVGEFLGFGCLTGRAGMSGSTPRAQPC